MGGERVVTEKPTPEGGIHEVNGIDRVNAKLEPLGTLMLIVITPAATIAVVTPNCELCGTHGHNNIDCKLFPGIPSDQVNYTQGNPYSNTYNLGWRNHSNFSYKNNNAWFPPNPTLSIPPGYQKGALVAP
ncbi:uncharacterized protein LOC127080180 [Lathyrus oleraceus]|uniref:uncharacterized protein LOC127080180 n=1 Tax=Pisum sativum TaxID=3888 RepID=UPI0021CFB079|nr:uncharacterized protein LOC127080180 [Pisum sativum]